MAKRAHNCRRIKEHRICQGERRLELKSGRAWKTYCQECGKKMLSNDLKKLDELLKDLDG